jgi:predicted RNase H-like nuclease
VRVAGVDGTKGGWVAVVMEDDRLSDVVLLEGIESRFAELESAEVIAIDVPIGFGPREADQRARRLVGGSSVFAIPHATAFDRERYGPGQRISAQAFALGPRIRHVTDLARTDRRFHEVHPEVCFWAMNGELSLRYRKKSAGGMLERMELLKRHGITIELEVLEESAVVPLDDVLDAAACAWSATRIARGDGSAVSLPDPPQQIDGHRVAIWY